ncbi:AraC family transcriptional regulator [Marinimicrobium sp. ARAG 43.8]|uniref:AraC family transcriptional regulator n=1 Tax=Marinimicrobium sp. ARAG 43.8 TaxID=3418719 RepID=UPI003CE884F1
MTAHQPIPNALDDYRRGLADSLARQIQKWAPEEGITSTSVPDLDLFRANSTATSMASSVYEPALCLIAQGGKTVWLGDREIHYGPLSCLASSVSLPVTGKITEASEEKPYLGVKISVNPQEVTDLLLELDEMPEETEDLGCEDSSCGLCCIQAERGLAEAILKLTMLLDDPRDARILAPMAKREVVYRALVSEIGVKMRKFAVDGTKAHRISKVIAALKDRFTEPLRVPELAEMANMSESSLFHSFKQVTRMSPLQFQKKLRLHEARRLMLSEGLEAATASFRVGYESPSHFSREYSRLFGAPPRSDVTKLRSSNEFREAARV